MIAWAEGDPTGALELLDRGRESLRCRTCWLTERAWLVEDLGSPEEAIEAWEASATQLSRPMLVNAFQWPIAYERLCHLNAQYGEATKAAQDGAQGVELWADADPELQPRVRAAQQRLEAVSEG